MSKGTVNKVIILGRLGQDPEIRATASGTQIANLSVATNEVGPKDDQGNRTDLTEWHRLIAFGRTAEIAAQYLAKGSQVYVEGRLQTRKWTDQQGQDRYSTEIIINEMQFIGGKNESGQAPTVAKPAGQPAHTYQPPQPQGGFQQPQQRQPQGFGQAPTGQPAPPPNGFEDFDDDIPF